jgi:DNA-binding IclR family transcriptional regulator
MTSSEIKAYLDRTEFVSFTPKTILKRDLLLAELERTRNRGYAVNNEEIALGRASLAATVFGSRGHAAGAISQTGTVEQIFGSAKDSIVRSLQATAGEISAAMGYYPAAPDSMKSLSKSASRNRSRKRSTI